MHSDEGYLPDILTREGIDQLLATACLVELQNALCPLSYSPTTGDIWIWQLGQKGLTAEDALELREADAAASATELSS